MVKHFLFIFFSLFIAACSYQKNNEEEVKVHIAENDSSKIYSGAVFGKNLKGNISVLFLQYQVIVKIFNEKNQLVCDTFPMTTWAGESLKDINNDGLNEFLVYTEGMSKYKNYKLHAFFFDQKTGKIYTMPGLDTLSSPRFFIGLDFFTSCYYNSEVKEGLKLCWMNSNAFNYDEIVSIRHNSGYDTCTAKYYKYYAGKWKLSKTDNKCELDTIFGMLHF